MNRCWFSCIVSFEVVDCVVLDYIIFQDPVKFNNSVKYNFNIELNYPTTVSQ